MLIDKTSKRYAKSLLKISLEKGYHKKVNEDILSIKKIIEEAPDFLVFMKSKLIKTDKKLNIIKEIFEKKVEKIILVFLKLLINQRREEKIELIVMSFIQQYKEYKNIVQTVVTTALKIDTEQEKEIIKLLSIIKKGKTFKLTKNVDSKIIGGVIIEFEDKQIDGSIRNELKEIKQKLIN